MNDPCPRGRLTALAEALRTSRLPPDEREVVLQVSKQELCSRIDEPCTLVCEHWTKYVRGDPP